MRAQYQTGPAIQKYIFYGTEQGKWLGVPWTNNLTEQMIGNGEVRSGTVRGYKSKDGLLAAFTMCALRLAWPPRTLNQDLAPELCPQSFSNSPTASGTVINRPVI